MSGGRYATIYRTQNAERAVPVAIKQFSLGLENPALQERAIAQFYAEFEMLSKASHPNLPRVTSRPVTVVSMSRPARDGPSGVQQ